MLNLSLETLYPDKYLTLLELLNNFITYSI